jgi:trigger factor
MRPSRMRDRSKDEYREELERTASERVKGILLLDAIGKKENIETTEEDINAALETEAQKQGRKALAVRAALEKNREWDSFVQRLRYNKIQDFLLSKTKVTYVERKPEEEGSGPEQA